MFLLLILILFLITIILLLITYLLLYLFGKKQMILIKWIFSVLIKMKVHKLIKNKKLEKEEYEYFFNLFKNYLKSQNYSIVSTEVNNEHDDEIDAIYKITIFSTEITNDNEEIKSIKKEFYVIEKHSKYIFSLFYPTNRTFKVFGELEHLFNYAKALNFLILINIVVFL